MERTTLAQSRGRGGGRSHCGGDPQDGRLLPIRLAVTRQKLVARLVAACLLTA